jgi:hypothetical protein
MNLLFSLSKVTGQGLDDRGFIIGRGWDFIYFRHHAHYLLYSYQHHYFQREELLFRTTCLSTCLPSSGPVSLHVSLTDPPACYTQPAISYIVMGWLFICGLTF